MNSFQILLDYLKAGGGDDDPKDIPALDKLPTNAFIDTFMGEDEGEDEGNNDVTVEVTSHVGTRMTTSRAGTRTTSRIASGTTSSAKLRACDSRIDDDIETVLDVKERFPPFDDTGQRAYENACTKFKALPIKAFHRQLADSTEIDMRYYGAGPTGAKAIAIPMVINTRITSLNLSGNGLTAEGFHHIVRMMSENDFITNLNVSENKLKTAGAKLICEMLQSNHNIEVLDISGNEFTNSDAKILCKAIENHTNLKVLNLSHNEFGEQAGKALGSMIGESGSIHDLDLAWNQIRGKAVTEVARGLKESICLKTLDLSWNGFGDKGCQEIATALRVCSLVELDMSSNRVGAEGVVALCRAVKDNEDIKILKIGKNPLPEEFVTAALDFFQSLDELHLQLLDMSDVTFSPRFKEKVDSVKEKHSQFTCQYGYSDSYGRRKLQGYSVVGEAMREIRKYCDHHNINIVELFARFDADGSMSVSHDEFTEGLKEVRIPISDEQIQLLIETFDQDGDGEIDFSEMVLGAEMYKD